MMAARHRFLALDEASWPPPLALENLQKWAEIDVVALRHNVEVIRRHVGAGVAIMAMVKANGYGHGALLAAKAFVGGGASWLGVSAADEALQLRHGGIDVPILITGFTPHAVMADVIDAGVDMAVFDVESAKALNDAAAQCRTRARVQVKIDSGMNRLGVKPAGLSALIDVLGDAAHVDVTGVFTHFASSDSDPAFTESQNRLFAEQMAVVRRRFPKAIGHAANSAATLAMPVTHYDVVRPGLALYGYSPIAAPHFDLRPALSLCARVTQVKSVERGETVGYGRTWQAEVPSRIAMVAIGYGDGVSWALGNCGSVIVGGHVCPVAGRISMDQISVDITGVADEVEVGEVVTLLGRDGDCVITAADIAARAGTISYEVLTGISGRVPRVAVE